MKNMKKPFLWLLCFLPVICLLVLYLLLTAYYRDTFPAGTWINGIYCTGKSVEEVNTLLCEATALTDIVVTDMEGKEETLSLKEAEGRVDYTASLQKLSEKKNPFFWIQGLLFGKKVRLSPKIQYNEEKLLLQLDTLSVIQRGKKTGPPTASVQKTEAGYILVENLQKIPNTDKIEEYLLQEIGNGEKNICLSEEFYEERKPTEEIKKTLALWEQIDDLQNCQIVYDMGDVLVPVDASVVADWIETEEDGTIVTKEGCPVLRETCFQEYITSLAEEFDTYNVPREFLSTRGDVITIEKGTYGNRLDRKKETAYLEKAFWEKRKEVHVPAYEQEALYKGKDDIGNTYIEVDMTTQTLYYYVEGELVMETPVVTGNVSTGHKTPSRICYVYLKQTDRILRGPGYASPVKYWMPVYGNIGIHDASWRSEFGGTIYKTNGSHGCINVPFDAVKALYEQVEIGTPVIMFY